jgi:uncharacterized membrane protein YbhN (UPF0104 family)
MTIISPRATSRLLTLGRRYGVLVLVVLLAGFLTLFVYRGRGEIAQALSLLRTINLLWIVPLFALQALVITFAALMYRGVLQRLGHRVGMLMLADVQLQRVLVGSVTPIGGPPSLYVMIRRLGQRGIPAGDVLMATSARSFAMLGGFGLIVPAALLFQRPNTAMLVASLILLSLLAGLGTGFGMVCRGWTIPGPIARRLPDRLDGFLQSIREQQIGVRDLVRPVLIGMSVHVVMAGMLFASLHAVGYQPAVDMVLVGYVAGNLMVLVAPVFRGVGMVELAMALALQRAGVPAVEAVGAALLYRLGDLWLPIMAASVIQAIRLPFARRLLTEVSGGTIGAGDDEAATPVFEAYRVGRGSVVAGMALVVESLSASGEREIYRAKTPDQRRNEIDPVGAISPTFTGLL